VIAEEAQKPKEDEPEEPAPGPGPGSTASPLFAPRLYLCSEPARLPRRQWLYARHLIRGYLSLLVAPGGVGKTALAIAECLDMVTGRGFLGEVQVPLRVLFWCGEDPLEELERRFAAARVHYGVTEANIGGRLYVNSGHDGALRLAIERPKGVTVNTALRDAMIEAIRRERLDVVVLDPFVATHLVNENATLAINTVAEIFKQIAHDAACGVCLLHHMRKPSGQPVDATANDARGAKALVEAARAVRVLNPMTVEEADRAGIDHVERRRLFRVDDGKQNMTPPAELATWRRLASVELNNGGFGTAGDNVQVAVAWQMPGAFGKVTERHLCEVQKQMGDGEFATVPQAENWLGWLVGRVTGLETESKGGRQHVRQVIEVWVKAGVILETQVWSPKNKRMQTVYRCGSRDRGGAQC